MIYSWKKIVKTGLPLLTIAVFVEIFAGSILQGKIDTLVGLTIFLISIPVINSVGGNIGSVLGSRIASGLHVGYINASLKDKKMHENLITSVLIGISTYIFLSIVIYYIGTFGNVEMSIGFIEFVGIFLSTGFFLICIVAFSSIIAAFISFKKGLDPDDMVAPVVTTVGDVFGIVILFFMISVFGVGI